MSNERRPQQVLDELLEKYNRLVGRSDGSNTEWFLKVREDSPLATAEREKIYRHALEMILNAKIYWSKADLKGVAAQVIKGVDGEQSDGHAGEANSPETGSPTSSS